MTVFPMRRDTGREPTRRAEPVESPVIVQNNATNSNSSLTNQSSQGKSPILGFVIGTNGKFSSIYYYVGAGVLGLIILLIIFRRKVKTDNSPTEPNPNKMKSKPNKQSKIEVKVTPQNIISSNPIDTEKRITELQKELEQIKNEEKLVQLQNQVIKERHELKKLRDGKEFKSQDFNNNSKIK